MSAQLVDATPPDINIFLKGGVHDAETMEAVFGPAGRYVESLESRDTFIQGHSRIQTQWWRQYLGRHQIQVSEFVFRAKSYNCKMTGADESARVVELEVKYEVIDLYWVYFGMIYRRVLLVFVLVPPAVVFAQGFSTNDFSFVPYLARTPWPQVWLVMLIFFLFGRPYLISKSLLRKDPFRFGDGHYRVNDESILVERSHTRSTVLWPSVQKATENSGAVILWLGAYTPIILPKRSFAGPAQLTILRSLIRDHVQGKVHLRR